MNGALEISLTALRANAAALRALVQPARAAFVVKGNAYGHGALEVARAVESLADRLCVYTIDEALALRAGGITASVLILGPIPPAALREALANDFEFALWDSGSYLRDLAAAVAATEQHPRVHLKINTGLNRFGVEPERCAELLDAALNQSGIEIAGIFSHLAAAEEIDSPYTQHQLARFAPAVESVRARVPAARAHIAASAAAMLWPQARLDLVRFGIALYGIWPSEQTHEAMAEKSLALVPVLSYRSQLVVVRTIEAGDAIGYGCSFHAPRGMRIGVLPLGYADGIPRLLSNLGYALVDGARCPILGRIAMNTCILDLSAAPSARVGSQVTLLGSDGAERIDAEHWARWAQSIAYEIVTRLPASLERGVR
ncbi:MAG TPA: alanine racemase [Candidatus Dormibacteraeota bacterium]|nr:alanine racemase [Candidatus Dormibacteraeota bacterium]